MIDKNIPIPSDLKPKWRNKSHKYFWRECEEIGDSFAIKEKITIVQQALKKFCQRNQEYLFVAKDMGDGTVRVWRVENDKKNS